MPAIQLPLEPTFMPWRPKRKLAVLPKKGFSGGDLDPWFRQKPWLIYAILFRNLANHLTCMKHCKWWDINNINWCRISSINSTTLSCLDSQTRQLVVAAAEIYYFCRNIFSQVKKSSMKSAGNAKSKQTKSNQRLWDLTSSAAMQEKSLVFFTPMQTDPENAQ